MEPCLAQVYQPDSGGKIIHIDPCDGRDQYHTLQQQLLDHGIIDQKWSLSDDVPGTIFHWFRHNAPYEPTGITFMEEGHCGVCFHDITNKYYFRLNDDRPLRLYDDVYIELPELLVSGCECIHLKESMQQLIRYIHAHYVKKGTVDIKFGRLNARQIIQSYYDWDPYYDEIAMPVAWFYFDPTIRHKLKLGQFYSGYGYHVFMNQTYKSIPVAMHYALRQQRTVRAYNLFMGRSEDGGWANEDTERQVASPYYYVIVSRSSASRLVKEI